MRSLAGGLRIIDETTEPIEAALAGRPENRGRRFGVQATYEAAVDQISFTGATQVITVADLERLPPADREFIADLEDSLDRNYKRWAAVRKGLGDAGGALDDEVERQLTRIAKIMCRDLQADLWDSYVICTKVSSKTTILAIDTSAKSFTRPDSPLQPTSGIAVGLRQAKRAARG